LWYKFLKMFLVESAKYSRNRSNFYGQLSTEEGAP